MAEGTQQHPLKTYFQVWALLFVFSAFSYWVDWYGFQGFTRWGLILLFMMLKAGFICAIFMHMWWERLAIKFAMLVSRSILLHFITVYNYFMIMTTH